jgi:hypothetical protein
VKLTNRLGLPRSIENAVRNDRYSRGDAHISVTGLIAPARKRAIEAAHQDEITEDVAERIWSLLGQIAHGILERADDQAWCEERLFIERHGWRISGSFDRYVLEEDGRLQDYKLTSTYSIKDGSKPEWEAQENIYALMLREHGYKVTRLDVVAILRDWQKSKAKHTQDYPQVPALVIPVEMWPADRTEAYLRDRLTAHGKAQYVLPECTAEERWERPAVFAVHKNQNIRATSLHPTTEAAEAAAEDLMTGNLNPGNTKYRVIERPAEQKRCQDYCAALPFCEQGQRLIKATEDFRLSQIWTVPASGPRASAAA